jgi:hypothetical protein
MRLRLRTISVSILLACSVCFGQSLSIGIAGGAGTTDDLTGAGATSVSKRYVLGPALDIGLPFRFGIEVDALYRREGYQSAFGNFAYNSFTDERANSWEFPMLLKYHLPFAVIKPFVEAGYAPRVIQGSISLNYTQLFPPSAFQHVTNSTNWPTSHGFVAGGGIQFGVGRLGISPALRYTHWNNTAISGFYGDGPSWRSTQNQVDILLGIAWKIR